MELDDEFTKELNDSDEVVEDILSGFYERRSDCVQQYGGWVKAERFDENPDTVAYDVLEDYNN